MGYTRSINKLQAQELERIDGDNRGSSINCLDGIIWVTQQGDIQDHILTAGEEFTITKRGLVLVQACTDASVLIE